MGNNPGKYQLENAVNHLASLYLCSPEKAWKYVCSTFESYTSEKVCEYLRYVSKDDSLNDILEELWKVDKESAHVVFEYFNVKPEAPDTPIIS